MGFWAFWANSSPILAQADLETTDTDGKPLETRPEDMYVHEIGTQGVSNGHFERVRMGFWAFLANSSPFLAQTDLGTDDTDGKPLK